MSKILIVDDDPGATTLLQKLMQSEGHTPTVVNDSSIAMGVARLINPEVVLLDLMMPEPTGFQLCRMLRDDPKFIKTPIIIVTALDDYDSKVVAFGAGANDYVTKPYRVEDLIQKISELLSEQEEE